MKTVRWADRCWTLRDGQLINTDKADPNKLDEPVGASMIVPAQGAILDIYVADGKLMLRTEAGLIAVTEDNDPDGPGFSFYKVTIK